MISPDENVIRLQLVKALDEWVKLEHALGKIFYVLLKPIDFPRSQSVFRAINGFQAQREAVTALVCDTISDEVITKQFEKLEGRCRSLATKRNRLVHGRWKTYNLSASKQLEGRTYFPPNMTLFTKDGSTVDTLKGKYIFFTDDLKRCIEEFRALTADLDAFRLLAASVLGISPNIEISETDIIEFGEH